MYIPNAFQQADADTLFDFMEQNSFATLVAPQAGRLVATHLPLLLDRRVGPHGQLLGHVARANPQWRALDGEVLVLFTGPHAYVSPSWYAAEDVVPTWNYVAVHAYGTARLIEDDAAMRSLLGRMVDLYEAGSAEPWPLHGSADFLQKMVRGVVGFAIDLHRIEGKWKLSQNHPRERQERVARALRRQGDENSQGVAAWMEANLKAQETP